MAEKNFKITRPRFIILLLIGLVSAGLIIYYFATLSIRSKAVFRGDCVGSERRCRMALDCAFKPGYFAVCSATIDKSRQWTYRCSYCKIKVQKEDSCIRRSLCHNNDDCYKGRCQPKTQTNPRVCECYN